MRPSVTEQLRGMRLILENVVAPEVTAPYPRDMLAAVVDALGRLETSWHAHLPAMRDESVEIDRLLAAASAVPAAAADGFGARVEAALAEPAVDPLDHDAALARYERRRGLLAELVARLPPPGVAAPDAAVDALAAQVHAHLRAHVQRS